MRLSWTMLLPCLFFSLHGPADAGEYQGERMAGSADNGSENRIEDNVGFRAGDSNAAQRRASMPPAGPGYNTQDWEPRRRGLLLHALFEHLPQLAERKRAAAGHAYLARSAQDMPEAARDALLGEALTVIEDGRFASLFGPNSQAELSVVGWVVLDRIRREVRGQIDRLVVEEERVVVVDYKTGPPCALHAIRDPL